MKTLAEFKSFYRQALAPTLQPLEDEREETASKVTFMRMIIVALTLFILAFEIHFLNKTGWGEDGFKLLFYTVIGSVVLSVTLEAWISSSFKSNFKHMVMDKVAKFIEPSADFNASGCISESVYTSSRLFNNNHERYDGEDYVQCRIGESNIEFSELHTYYYVRTKNGRRRVTVFKGLFLVADFNKSFKGKTYALPDLAEKSFGSWIGGMLQQASKGYGDVMPMDDPEFEKEFVVYGSDPVEARYILSNSLMQRMLGYAQKTGKKVRYAFVGSRIFMAIHYNKNLFEPNLYKTLLDEEEVSQFYEELLLFMSVVEDLNLNTRLWQKGA